VEKRATCAGTARLGNESIDRVAENAAESCIYPEPVAVATACDSDAALSNAALNRASLLRINPSWICWSARRASASIRAEIAVDFSVNALSTHSQRAEQNDSTLRAATAS
jgi:hypothetical protein